MVFSVLVHVPKIVYLFTGNNILSSKHSGHHAVVLVVVFVHPVPTHEVKTLIIPQTFFDGFNMTGIKMIVNRIGLFLPYHVTIGYIYTVGEANLLYLFFPQGNKATRRMS